ncbi:RusA family crossover junction endodeoxyribonuclease [Clostridium botulinum]|uniref:RusA family crossover junction endodeoxyribonuclease n=1 Tax=Clostridium botulinum TaxID=1491 RepID=UPI0005B43300|nr:RusA family crossover junction endodeoxyribonuclease [Clostridium botulinum]MBN3351910.1 hypothetical protein [Clostridium botulinum]MBN3371758.1 hypothetical protein [Clostridium botulinum]MBN3376407.1 hypothetical protein [Clostridium botulinum]MBN3402944.1 hypothetical protein [Clostridium botulinum]MBN3447798.1 hypothetical protein [Clostridium botulinum]
MIYISKEFTNTLKLTIPIPPSINNDYMKPKGILKFNPIKKKYYAIGTMYETAEAKKFKKDMIKLIKKEIDKQNFKPIENHSFVYLYWTWFFPSIKNDTNNRYKCAIDSITEFSDEFKKTKIWNDDNISMNKDVKIYYDSKNPRVELEIKYAPDIGIFDNEEDYNKFINTYCNNCKKGNKIGQKGGCSIYKKILESRIIEEVEINFDTGEKKCLNFKQK